MKPEVLSKFKRMLEEASDELKLEIEKLRKPKDFGDDIDSLEEESDETEEFGNRLSVANEYSNRLANINAAFRKIDEGKYGICKKCGNEIEEDVLEAVPESELCKGCKKHSR